MSRKEEITERLGNFFKEKANDYDIEMVFLYGSLACGKAKQQSDVDIAVVFQKNFTEDIEVFECISDMSFRLSSEINLEVNIIPVYYDFRKPMLYYNAIVLGIPIYIRDHNKYVEIKNQAIYQMEDFSIFGINWQLTVARKNIMEVNSARI